MDSLAAIGNVLASLIEVAILLALPLWVAGLRISRLSGAVVSYLSMLEVSVLAWAWILSAIALFNIWGGAGIAIGVLSLGIGVIPWSLVALLFHAHWLEFSEMVVQLLVLLTIHRGKSVLKNRVAVLDYAKRGGPTAEQIAALSTQMNSMLTRFKEDCARLRDEEVTESCRNPERQLQV